MSELIIYKNGRAVMGGKILSIDMPFISQDECATYEVRFIATNVTGNEIKPTSPKRILQSGNRTIVFWSDGTKTIVKRAEDEENNPYVAFTAALAIKTYGTNSKVKSIVDRKLEVQERDTSTGKMEVVEDYEARKKYRKWIKRYLKEKSDEQKSD